ncbi:MAG: hypothetical protein Q4G08_07845 [Capnocytophaga sp.]|nr:hypothetical protein [Capnocytophaga sp.]
MRYPFYLIQFLFHPIWYPMYGMIFCIIYSPENIPVELAKYTWTALVLSSVAFPTLAYIGLRIFNWMPSPFQIYPKNKTIIIYGYMVVLLILSGQLIPRELFPELSFYISALLTAYFISVLLIYLKIPVSLYTMAAGSFTSFLIFTGELFHIDILTPLACMFILSGWVASARIYHQQQSLTGTTIGWLVGFSPLWILHFATL